MPYTPPTGAGSDTSGVHLDTANEYSTLPEKTVPVGADIFAIEDSADSGAKKKVQIGNLPQPVFGTEISLASSDSESTTTSSNYQQKLRLTTPSLPSGTYRIGWYYEAANNTQGSCVYVQGQLNDTTTLFQTNTRMYEASYFISGGGGFYAASLSGVQNIDIDYRAEDGGTARIRRVRLELWRIS
jgi:hypothetical protein